MCQSTLYLNVRMWVSGTRFTVPTMAPVDLSLSLIACYLLASLAKFSSDGV
jgi:hypothetical protein